MSGREITVPQFAKKAGKSRQYILRLVKNGRIPARKVAGRYIISEEDALSLLGNNLSPVDKDFNQALVDLVFRRYGETMQKLALT